MQKLSQRDIRWGETYIGASTIRIKDMGCTLTDISMITDWFKCFLNPREIASHSNWFTKDGKVIWTKLNFDKVKWIWRQYGFMPAKIDESLADPNKAVILELNGGAHWVLAARKLPGGLYWVIDPYDGKAKINVRKITGSSHFQRK